MYFLLVLLFDCCVGVVILINSDVEDVCIVLMQVVLKYYIVLVVGEIVVGYLWQFDDECVVCCSVGYVWFDICVC